MSAEDDLRLYLDTLFGYEGAHGFLHFAIGHDPYLSEKGKYKHRNWEPRNFIWPDDADDAVRVMLSAATHSDVYGCPYLMSGTGRAKHCSMRRPHAHSDVDGGALDLDAVRALDGFAIGSGTPGNGHVYVLLSRSVSFAHHEQLCRALGEHLGTKDTSKISDNDLLRPPGTFNYKPTVHGEPTVPVTWLVRP
jgi:hypothetical protein